jgi:hypothetical protein
MQGANIAASTKAFLASPFNHHMVTPASSIQARNCGVD